MNTLQYLLKKYPEKPWDWWEYNSESKYNN